MTKKQMREQKVLKMKTMTKKEFNESNKSRRVLTTMNTGTQTHRTAKDYDRRQVKRDLRKAMDY